MAGRPPLPLNSFGKITRTQLPDGRWRARCRYRGADGITRPIQRDSPPGIRDSHGKSAEDALRAALAKLAEGARGSERVTSRTTLVALLNLHMEAVRSPERGLARRTIDRYGQVAVLLRPRLGGLRIEETTARALSAILSKLEADHGKVTGKQAKTLLSGAFALAVAENAAVRSVVRDIEVTATKRATTRKPTQALKPADLRTLLDRIATSDAPLPPKRGAKKGHTSRTVAQYCRDVDLVDPITLLAATGLRRSELLALTWADYSKRDRTLTIRRHLVRAGKTSDDGTETKSELVLEEETKSAAGQRVIALPEFACAMLDRRRRDQINPDKPVPAQAVDSLPAMIFPTSVGTLVDPDTFAAHWRRISGAIGFGWVGTHSFRKTVATTIDGSGLSARVAADVLGHARVSMTSDTYFGRGGVHRTAADALDAVVRGTAETDPKTGTSAH